MVHNRSVNRDTRLNVVILRSDDGETWKEHTLAYLESRWEGGEEEIYQVRINLGVTKIRPKFGFRKK